jgi:hypothetical protein
MSCVLFNIDSLRLNLYTMGEKAEMHITFTWSLIPMRLDVLDDVYYVKEEIDYMMKEHT